MIYFIRSDHPTATFAPFILVSQPHALENAKKQRASHEESPLMFNAKFQS